MALLTRPCYLWWVILYHCIILKEKLPYNLAWSESYLSPFKICLSSWFCGSDFYQLLLETVLLTTSSLECLITDKAPENPESENFLTSTCFIALAITTLYHSGSKVMRYISSWCPIILSLCWNPTLLIKGGCCYFCHELASIFQLISHFHLG